ncbi:MAG: class I SAM-dependent methyltransferase [Acidimicrobiales bacterium]|nr:class I SAM-dependent methyltransferase [Acidimicrobiales bacterium]
MNGSYDDDFYAGLAGSARASASKVLPIVLEFVSPARAIDVGCGTGDWLSALAGLTACDVIGLDGPYVPAELLAIPRSCFRPTDLTRPLTVDERFDLAMSIEVAEHLPPARAQGFVRELTALAPAVLFSAAIPQQGGVEHINERWQSYWIDAFASNGFEAWDVVRPALWHDRDVAFWCRQNLFLFVDPSIHGHRPNLWPIIADAVHPQLLATESPGMRELLSELPAAMGRSLTFHLARARSRLRR